jgi:Domain of unknown function (DUF4902)
VLFCWVGYTNRQTNIQTYILPHMKTTNMGLVQATMKELLNQRLEHFFSAIDADPDDLPPNRRCGTVTTLTGYTEWLCSAEFPITIGWDWHVLAAAHGIHWKRKELPRTNIQLLNEDGDALAWDDSLLVLSTWVDAQAWQKDVVQAVSAGQT